MADLDFGATITGFREGQKVFGRFTLKRLVGRGGMGMVWLARDDELEQDIAIKFLPELVATDKAALDDLRRETRRSRELTHPNIVRIHDFVRDERTAGITMEYVEGDTLSNLRTERPGKVFEPSDLHAWMRQLCAALDYAHGEAKVVHRDLKPANLMVTAKGTLKIADFGISATVSDTATRVSKVAGTSGTPVYMSPQQMMGDKPAPTDDIYSLGATLYELLTGKPPFYTGNLLMQVQNKVPSTITQRRRELEVRGAAIPSEWEQTIAACLAKDPAQRPQSAAEVAQRLGLAVAAPTVAAKPVPAAPREKPAPVVPDVAAGKKRNPMLYAGLAVAALAVAGGVWYYFGVYASEQKRIAEQNRLIAERKLAEEQRLATERREAEQKRLAEKKHQAEVAAAARRPPAGRAWTIPDLALEMLPIAAGTFTLGSPSSEEGRDGDEGPPTRVTITQAYWLGKTEVTQGQWVAVIGNNPSSFKGEDRPVEYVSWTDAMDFCRKLTARERSAGRLPDGYVYTLPTEAQWEYACRAGTTDAYAGNLDAMGWYSSNSGGQTHPVAQKQANAWGLYDMHGNVWEWCLDWFGNYPGGSVTDPTGPSSGSVRVGRGGGWYCGARVCRSAGRYGNGPGFRGLSLGFRLALCSVR